MRLRMTAVAAALAVALTGTLVGFSGDSVEGDSRSEPPLRLAYESTHERAEKRVAAEIAEAAERKRQAEIAAQKQAAIEVELARLKAKREAAQAKANQLKQVRATMNVPGPVGAQAAILACIRSYEGAYTSNTGNGYYGAYQYDQPTWNSNAGPAGYPEWYGRRAHEAPPGIQDAVAWFTYQARGLQPWGNKARANCRWPNLNPK